MSEYVKGALVIAAAFVFVAAVYVLLWGLEKLQ